MAWKTTVGLDDGNFAKWSRLPRRAANPAKDFLFKWFTSQAAWVG